MKKLEATILRNLFYNEEFTRKVLPFIKEEYFTDKVDKIVFKQIESFVNKYNNLPTYESVVIDLTESKIINETDLKSSIDLLDNLKTDKDETIEFKWLTEQTEKFCQDRAIYNAIMESVQILDNNKRANGEIPQLLSDALGVTFDTNIGHDYINDSENRFDFYHRKEEKIKFDLDMFNKITKGGLPNKTLNIALAGTGVGKSLFMCHVAAGALSQGKNVLYITLEMAEEKIAERIDANLLNIDISDLHSISREDYERKIGVLRAKTNGKLIIKEFPTAAANALHFRSLLSDLQLKKNFRPDIIMIDYLNICSSSRVKPGANVNTYSYIKSIAEELRGLAVEYNLPIISATQTTRSGFSSSDPGLEDTSESFGLPATADFMFALISTEELEQLGQIMVKQLKNRYNDPNVYKRFVLGIDRPKMRLYDAEVGAQNNIVDSNIPDVQDRPNKFSKNFEGIKV
jgi:replicative DNA helicase